MPVRDLYVTETPQNIPLIANGDVHLNGGVLSQEKYLVLHKIFFPSLI